MSLSSSIDLDNEYFRVEHISDSRDVRRAIGDFSAGDKAEGLERYLKDLALADEADGDARTYLVRDVVTNELAAYFSLRACLVPVPIDGTDIYTIPAIELSNFARNKAYRSTGKRIEKIGGYVFVRFVQPLVRHVSSLIGARLLCLYALPVSRLIRYYETLGFRRLDAAGAEFVHGRIKPKYDQGCVFMFRGI